MANEKSSNLTLVFEKAKSDASFAKEVFSDPTRACDAAGIKLNRTEIKILGDAMKDAHKYFIERLYMASQPTEVLANIGCGICFLEA